MTSATGITMSRGLLIISIILIVLGVGSFVVALPQAQPLVDGLWALNNGLGLMSNTLIHSVSTFVENLWKGAAALPLSLKLALVGLILLSVFALQRYAQRVGRPVVDLLPPPVRWPLEKMGAFFEWLVFLLQHRLAATAFLVLTFLMICYFATAILNTYANGLSWLGNVPVLSQFAPTVTPTPMLPTATPLPQMPRELWDGEYAAANNRGTPPTEIAIRQAIAARDSALTNFRRWLRGDINWSSAELRLKQNDADAARTYFFQNVGGYPESVWPPRVREVRAQLDEQLQYLRSLLDVMQKAEAKDWNGALVASAELDRLSPLNVRGDVEQAATRARQTPTATPTIAVIIVLPSVTPSQTPSVTPTPTRTPIPTITATPTRTPTATPDAAARMILNDKEAVANQDWKLAEYITGELNQVLTANDPRRKDLAAWLADRAEQPLLYVDPPGSDGYRPSVADVCLSYHQVNLALTLDNNLKASRLRTRVGRWLDYYSTQDREPVYCN